MLIWDVGQLLAVVFGDNELLSVSRWVRKYAMYNGFSGLAGTYSMTLAQRLDVHEGQRLLTLEELEGGDLACIEPWCEPSRFLGQVRAVPCNVMSLEPQGRHTPLMILQKIQAAILLDMSAHLRLDVWRRGNWVSER